MSHRKGMQWFAVVALLLVMASLGPASAAGPGAVVTKGRFVTLAGGTDLGYDITGTAVMVRNRANGGVTRVKVTVAGLDPSTTYKVHVHNAVCVAPSRPAEGTTKTSLVAPSTSSTRYGPP